MELKKNKASVLKNGNIKQEVTYADKNREIKETIEHSRSGSRVTDIEEKKK